MEPSAPVRNRSHVWFLLAFYSLALVWGVRNVYYWMESPLDLLMPIVFAMVLAGWALADARGRGEPIPMLGRQWFFLLAGVLVPGYVICTRRFWGAALIVLHFVGWSVLATIVTYAGGLAVFGEEWLRAMGRR